MTSVFVCVFVCFRIVSTQKCVLNVVVLLYSVKSNPPGKELSEDDCLRIVISLIIENVISPKVAFNAYG